MEEYNQVQNQFENQSQADRPPMPNNSMPLAIIGTIVGLCSPCCIGLILGIIAIVFASQVNSKYRNGDFTGAESSAKNAKLLSYIAIGLAVLGIILNVIMIMSMGGIDGYMEYVRQMSEQYS